MAEKFRLELVTPTRHLVSQEVEELTVPGIEGEFGVLPGHTPFLTALGVGELTYRIGNEQHFVAVANGFAEVKHEKTTILAEEALFAGEIDLREAEAARAAAEKELEAYSIDSKEYLETQARLERAMNTIQVANRRR
ncbi:MAG: F0F1 ATP synthase subunit epsilon [Deltaproteobacteria bacterium]|nr:F0F1 ATP synthase subunit epsilon [Deltaproteobacteria bacterium]